MTNNYPNILSLFALGILLSLPINALAEAGDSRLITRLVLDEWFFNFDIKYLDIDSKAKFVATGFGAAEFDLEIDPFLIGFGLGKKF